MKNLGLIAIATVCIGLLSQSGVLSAALVFLITGYIPSTNYSLTPATMLILMTIGLWLLLFTSVQAWVRTRRAKPQLTDSLASRRRKVKLS